MYYIYYEDLEYPYECSECGAAFKDLHRVCPNCGAVVEDDMYINFTKQES